MAGALRGKVFVNMGHFVWKPNFFVVFVAPPGVVSKSTTANVGMGMLRGVEGIHFGPESGTWQAITDAFRDAEIMVPEISQKMSALTIIASELGTLLDPRNREMIDVLNDLWDGRDVPWTRRTKGDGVSEIQNPWLNFIGCTTPTWITENFPQHAIGGGFTSRTVFVWGEAKRSLIAYPKRQMDAKGDYFARIRMKLVNDLKVIAKLAGEYVLTPDAFEWGEAWYERHWRTNPDHLDPQTHGGYISRKQTHLHKTAMVLAAAQRDELFINSGDLERAEQLVTSLEINFDKIFGSFVANREVYCQMHLRKLLDYFPEGISKQLLLQRLFQTMSQAEIEIALKATVAAGYVTELAQGSEVMLRPRGKIQQQLNKAAQKLSASEGPVHAVSAPVSAVLKTA